MHPFKQFRKGIPSEKHCFYFLGSYWGEKKSEKKKAKHGFPHILNQNDALAC